MERKEVCHRTSWYLPGSYEPCSKTQCKRRSEFISFCQLLTQGLRESVEEELGIDSSAVRIATEKVKPSISQGETIWHEIDITSEHSFRAVLKRKATVLVVTELDETAEAQTELAPGDGAVETDSPPGLEPRILTSSSSNPLVRPTTNRLKRRRSSQRVEHSASSDGRGEDDSYNPETSDTPQPPNKVSLSCPKLTSVQHGHK